MRMKQQLFETVALAAEQLNKCIGFRVSITQRHGCVIYTHKY